MRIYYENSQGQILDLMNWPYRLQTGNLFDFSLSYVTSGSPRTGQFIKRFDKEVSEISLTLTVSAQTEARYNQALDGFSAVTDYDIFANVPGRLYINDQYLYCYIFASKKTEWEYGIQSLDNTITLVTDRSGWITEKKYQFFYQEASETDFLDYPYDYPYDFAGASTIQNTRLTNSHYKDCDFLAQIYGPCVSPQIIIGGVSYQVTTSLEEGESLLINTREKTVIRLTASGAQVNEFNNRSKTSSFFRKIRPGRLSVTWNGQYNFDITLYEERPEPKWS